MIPWVIHDCAWFPIPDTRVVPDSHVSPDTSATPGDRCPCRSGRAFGACCAPLLAGREDARTALDLMRSRYTAYALGDAGYVVSTWHPSTRPAALTLDPETTWRSLHIVDTVDGGPDDAAGVVEFVARYRDGNGAGLLAERSRFIRDGGAWRYLEAM